MVAHPVCYSYREYVALDDASNVAHDGERIVLGALGASLGVKALYDAIAPPVDGP